MKKKIVIKRRPPTDEPGPKGFLSTGSSLLNMAISGHPDGGIPLGKYALLVGDSTSGKTLLSMTILAEAARNPELRGHRLVYDNVEDGMMMDIPGLFGTKLAERIEPPKKAKDGEPIYSESVQEFYYHLDDNLKKGPVVYILDSMDGLTSESEETHFQKAKKAAQAGKAAKGSYGDGKAKANSAGLRKALAGLRDTGSILIVIAQTRDNLDAGLFVPKKTRSGGHALRFYATVEVWSSLGGPIKRTVRGKERKIGDRIIFRVKKNRITGRLGETFGAIYPGYGLDDIGAMVDWLVEEGKWGKQKGDSKINPDGYSSQGMTRQEIIREAEENPKKLRKIKRLIREHWMRLESELSLGRPGRFE